MKRRRAGFTLIELLITAVILGVILVLLGDIFVSTRRGYQVNETVSTERQNVQAVNELLQYDIGLAGYRCTDSGATSRSFAANPLEVTDGASGAPDTITAQYYEDRFTSGGGSGCISHTVTYSVQDGTLYRTDNGDKQPAVKGVSNLQVSSWLDDSNSEFITSSRPEDKALAGIGITIDFTTGASEIITIGLQNPQCPKVSDCL